VCQGMTGHGGCGIVWRDMGLCGSSKADAVGQSGLRCNGFGRYVFGQVVGGGLTPESESAIKGILLL